MKAHIKNEADPIAGTIDPGEPRYRSYAWYEAMYRRLEVDHEITLAALETQDARLAKAGADLEECRRLASELITQIGAEKEARAVIERIAAHRLDELVDLRAQVLELEPLAEVGRRMLALPEVMEVVPEPRGWCIYRKQCPFCARLVEALDQMCEAQDGASLCDIEDSVLVAVEKTLLAALRAAGIGEEVEHG